MTQCPFCGAALLEAPPNCPECGRDLASLPPEGIARLDFPTLERLRSEKARLARELSEQHKVATQRTLTESEHRQWEATRAAWQAVTVELAQHLDYVAPREGLDRRAEDRRQRERRAERVPKTPEERRTHRPRRQSPRRSRPDRRDPFVLIPKSDDD
jgi:hypothetical protein